MIDIQIVISFLYYVAILLIIASGFSIMYSIRRFINFDHAITLSLSAYITYTLVVSCQWTLFWAVPLAVVLSIIFAVLIDNLIFGPLRKNNLKNWQMMVASLGIYVILQNLISIIWGDSTLSFRTWEVSAGHELFGAYVTDVQIITIVACLLIMVMIWLFMEKTIIGKQIKAVSINDELSGIFGLNGNRAKVWSVILGSLLASCAGILIAADTDMTPTMGFNWLLYGVVAMIIGGVGKIRYLVLGSLLLATAQHLAAYFLDSKWMNAIAYIILIAFLFFRPTGFSGKILKKINI